MARAAYWAEVITEAAEEADLTLTPTQIGLIASAVMIAHENYGMAFYSPPPGEHLTRENKRLERDLERERSKNAYQECGGRGRIYIQGPYHGSDSQCSKCRGEGKHCP